ncbi:MAG: hypothetical protein Q8874_02870 [Sweet potato little leaf phytoplasma]|nr:hypothetical protein [Sweet potato little leaf phytoplasma]
MGSSLSEKKIPKITHSKPMLSLENAFDIAKVKKSVGTENVTFM